MTPIEIASIAFALASTGILLGRFTQKMVPEAYLGSDSKEAIKLSMGVVATLAALVLGLLVASANTTYGSRKSEINQITAYTILLDNLLAQYGGEAQTARDSLHRAIPAMVNRIWKEAQSGGLQAAPFKPTTEGEDFYQRIQNLEPSNDSQRELKQQITQVATDLAQTRLLLFSHLSNSIPLPFLAVLVLWVIILLAGFSLMAPSNPTTFAALLVCALSVCGAIFLILELDEPFSGLMSIRSEPLLNALPPLGA
jgi:hypothetical protein